MNYETELLRLTSRRDELIALEEVTGGNESIDFERTEIKGAITAIECLRSGDSVADSILQNEPKIPMYHRAVEIALEFRGMSYKELTDILSGTYGYVFGLGQGKIQFLSEEDSEVVSAELRLDEDTILDLANSLKEIQDEVAEVE